MTIFSLILQLVLVSTVVCCNRPNRLEKTFDIGSIADKTFYVVRGLDPMGMFSSCYDCHNMTFLPDHHDIFMADEHCTLKLNDSTEHYHYQSTVSQWNATTPGVLDFHDSDYGSNLEWRVIVSGDTFIFAYYCGTYTGNFTFEGSVVLSRTPYLKNDTYSYLRSVASSVGLNLDGFCKPRFDECDTYLG